MLLLYVFNWLLMGGIASYYSKKRGRNSFTWFFVGLFFGILGVILLFILPKKGETPVQQDPIAEPESAPPPLDAPPLFWYYVDGENKRQGPMSQNAFEHAKLEGKIAPTSYVWNTDMAGWKRLEEI